MLGDHELSSLGPASRRRPAGPVRLRPPRRCRLRLRRHGGPLGHDGLEVAYLLVTRGDAGGFDATPRERMPAIREAEQRAAAAILGVKQVDFLEGYSDGLVTPSLELRKEITAAIRRFRPDRILTSSPLR